MGQFSTPISPLSGSFLHADSHRQPMEPSGPPCSDAVRLTRELEEALLNHILGIVFVLRNPEAGPLYKAGVAPIQSRKCVCVLGPCIPLDKRGGGDHRDVPRGVGPSFPSTIQDVAHSQTIRGNDETAVVASKCLPSLPGSFLAAERLSLPASLSDPSSRLAGWLRLGNISHPSVAGGSRSWRRWISVHTLAPIDPHEPNEYLLARQALGPRGGPAPAWPAMRAPPTRPCQ